MDNITYSDILSFITTISVIVGIVVAITTIGRNQKADNKAKEVEAVNEAKEEASHTSAVLLELGHIKCSIEDMKKAQEKQIDQTRELLVRIVAVEESAKQAHKRIDEIKNKEK